MKLSDALDIRSGDRVTFIGAGGKSTSLVNLAGELVVRGMRVLCTTTTRMALSEMKKIGVSISIDEVDESGLTEINSLLDKERCVFLYSSIIPGKVTGLTCEFIDIHLSQSIHADVILVEGDGSRRLPLKAPFDHEPVVPETATKVVTVAGLSVLHEPFNDSSIYGYTNVIEVLGERFDKIITPELAAEILSHPDLGLKGHKKKQKSFIILNQVDENNLEEARQIAGKILGLTDVEKVLITAMHEQQEPVKESRSRFGVVILAAGQSSRLGRSKLFLQWQGKTLLENAVKLAVYSQPVEIVVVAGGEYLAVKELLKEYPVKVVHNPAHATGGQLSSLQVGIRSLEESSVCAVLPSDAPFISKKEISACLNAYFSGLGKIIIPVFRLQRGHPVILDQSIWEGLLQERKAKNPRDVLNVQKDVTAEVQLESDQSLFDIDTEDDYQKALERECSG